MKIGAYRPDIDGIRAIAVLSVLFFHLGIAGFSGGYVGVDVFFVISGYLITGLIRADLVANTFSLRAFYLRRVRRLAPALIVVSVAVSVVAAVLLYPEDMRSFGSSLALQFVSLQNIGFLSEGEYFRGSEAKLLLHTWTLAVEEQFYLLWPLLLLVTHRLRFRTRLLMLVVALIASFVLNLGLMSTSPKASFFLLPSRAWELGIGGSIALLEEQKWFEQRLNPTRRAIAGFAGLLALIGSVATFTSNTSFPGWAALLPVCGAALLIVAGMGGTTPIGKLLSRSSVVHVGLISYPLYLWHWPLVSMAHHLGRSPQHAVVAATIIAAAVGLAELTYRFVERPIRSRRVLSSSKQLLGVAGVAAVGFALLGVHAMVTQGAAYRFPPAARPFLTAPLAAADQRCGFLFRVMHSSAQVCPVHEEPSSARRVLLWGNSHANMWSGLFKELGTEHDANVYINARNCRAVTDSKFCGRKVQDAVLKFIASEHVTDVVLASSWYGAYRVPDPVFERSLADAVTKLLSYDVRIWLVIDAPNGRQLNPVVAYEKNPTAPRFGSIAQVAHRERSERELTLFRRIAGDQRRIEIIDPATGLCGTTECPGGKDGTVWYRDEDHLTYAGARVARAQFEPIFEKQN